MHYLCLKEWHMMRDEMHYYLGKTVEGFDHISPQVLWGEYNKGSCFYVLTFYLQYSFDTT